MTEVNLKYQEIRSLLDQKKSYRQIQEILHCSPCTIRKAIGEKKESATEIVATATPKISSATMAPKIQEQIRTTNGLHEQARKYGKHIPLDICQDAYDLLRDNRIILNRLMNHYDDTWFKNKVPGERGKMREEYDTIKIFKEKMEELLK